MSSDIIADLLTRIRNASAARKRIVEMPASKMKESVVQVLLQQGFIASYKVVETPGNVQPTLKVALKYDRLTKEPAITKITRVSTPGLRQYTGSSEVPRVMNGLGIAILSTSKGIMTGKQAKEQNVGGEVLCYVS